MSEVQRLPKVERESVIIHGSACPQWRTSYTAAEVSTLKLVASVRGNYTNYSCPACGEDIYQIWDGGEVFGV